MKQIKLIHKWIGLLISLFLFISCFTGIFILIGKLIMSYAPIFKWMKSLHRNLFLGETGSLIIGIASLLVLVEVITGYLLWWKSAKGLMIISHKRGESRWKGFWKSLNWKYPNKTWGTHVAAGFWTGIPLLLMAITGLTWSFGWFSDIIFGIFDTSGSGDLFHTIAALHTGSFWGVWSRLLWLLFAILGASLPISGCMLYLKKVQKSTKKVGA